MKNELMTGNIIEINCTPNLCYILNDNNMFSTTGYKFLQTQEEYFIPCKSLVFNGKKKLVFFTNGYKCLNDIIGSIDNKDIFTVLALLVKTVIEIKSNGFLSCNNVHMALEKMFLDTKTTSIKLIYLPINNTNSASNDFEHDLKRLVSKVIRVKTSLPTVKKEMLEKEILRADLTVEALYRLLYEEYKLSIAPTNNETVILETKDTSVNKSISLVLTNVASGVKIKVNKNEFVIGKSVNADGVISDNKAVSRKHCKIIKREDNYFIIDLESANGTYLNDSKVVPNKEYHLTNGNKIRLANSDWMVKL